MALKVDRRKLIIGGGVIVASIVGYAYWRRRQANAAPLVDTATGSPTDANFTNPVPNASGADQVNDAGAITSDATWAQDAATKLESAGWDPQFVITALGAYLSGQGLTTDQASLIRNAWALSGRPPGNQPIIMSTTGGSTPGTGNPTPPPPASTPPDQPAKQTPTPKPPRRYVIASHYTASAPPWDSTLSGIAGHTGRSVAELASWNGIANPDKISAGQRIYVDPPGVGKYIGTKRIN